MRHNQHPALEALKRDTDTNPNRGRTFVSSMLCSAMEGVRLVQEGDRHSKNGNLPPPPPLQVSTPCEKPTIPRGCVSIQWEGGNAVGVGGASLLPVHPLTSIRAITLLLTPWFHVTRWPTGWTTKTRNMGH